MQVQLRLIFLVFVVVWASMLLWGPFGFLVGIPLAASVVTMRIAFAHRRMLLFILGIALLGITLSVYVLFVGPSPAFREDSRRGHCMDNLYKIAYALREYHSVHERFPPAYVADKHGNRLHSWRVLILPYLGEKALYDQYDFDASWDSVRNHKLSTLMPRVFRCPNEERDGYFTSYVAVVGPGTAWPDAKCSTLDEFPAPSSTIMLVEIGDSAIQWMAPCDVTIEELLSKHYADGRGIEGHRVPWDVSSGKPASFVATADGGVYNLSRNLQPSELRDLFMVVKQGADNLEEIPHESLMEGIAWSKTVGICLLIIAFLLLVSWRDVVSFRHRNLKRIRGHDTTIDKLGGI